jgi:hypothetical protein
MQDHQHFHQHQSCPEKQNKLYSHNTKSSLFERERRESEKSDKYLWPWPSSITNARAQMGSMIPLLYSEKFNRISLMKKLMIETICKSVNDEPRGHKSGIFSGLWNRPVRNPTSTVIITS